MNKVTNKNRNLVITNYVNSVVDGMGCEEAFMFAKILLDEKCDGMNNLALEELIKEDCPQILENLNDEE